MGRLSKTADGENRDSRGESPAETPREPERRPPRSRRSRRGSQRTAAHIAHTRNPVWLASPGAACSPPRRRYNDERGEREPPSRGYNIGDDAVRSAICGRTRLSPSVFEPRDDVQRAAITQALIDGCRGGATAVVVTLAAMAALDRTARTRQERRPIETTPCWRRGGGIGFILLLGGTPNTANFTIAPDRALFFG